MTEKRKCTCTTCTEVRFVKRTTEETSLRAFAKRFVSKLFFCYYFILLLYVPFVLFLQYMHHVLVTILINLI